MNEIKFYSVENGTKIKYIRSCELCKFVSSDLLNNNLVCLKDYEVTNQNELCNLFKLNKQFKKQMIGLIKGQI